MIKYEDLDLLRRFAEENNDECGEALYFILELYSYRNHLSENLTRALEQELQDTLQDIKENWEYVEREETQKVMVREWRYKNE